MADVSDVIAENTEGCEGTDGRIGASGVVRRDA
jgi:hypothetical protein